MRIFVHQQTSGVEFYTQPGKMNIRKVTMNTKEAIEILTQVCNQYRGLLTEHQVIKEALKVVSELEVKEEEPKKEKE